MLGRQDEPMDFKPVMHKVSVVKSIDNPADPYNTIGDVWFIYAGNRVTAVPENGAFEIHCSYSITKEYLQNHSTGWDPSADWKAALVALSNVDNIAVYDEDGAFFNTAISRTDFNLYRVFPSYNGTIMRTHDLVFTIYLLGNLAFTQGLPTPPEIRTAFGS
jgi:hypothetical protein